jgi:DNA segregation ATPase FtsK/SpoIIIE, S-DNA-T family
VAVTLQVRDVRAAIYCAAGARQSSGEGSPSTALLGRLFHEVFATLVSTDESRNFRAAIDDAEPELYEWQRALIKHTYQCLVGPRLRQHQAVLHHVTEQMLTFWDGVQEMCHWLGELLWMMRERGDQEISLPGTIQVEQPLVLEMTDPEWTDAVKLTGVADAIWRIPDTERWCVVELKTGRTAPEADLAQVCLYHQMLLAAGEADTGTLALVSFEPDRRETLFTTSQLIEAQSALRRLIGRLAGVLPDENSNVQILPISKMSVGPAISSNHSILGEQLLNTLREYGAEVTLDGSVIEGPAFLRYPITLGSRVKLRAVERLATEIQVRLQLDAPPRIGTESGRVVIDLQRPDRQPVLFSQIRAQLPWPDTLLGCSQAPLGVDINGQMRMIDFAQPEDAHLLVAGTTGSGKSEWLRTAIAGLIVTNRPATLRLLIIDPKRNVFHALRYSPYLYYPIVFPDEEPVAQVLTRLADEMDHRYQLLGENGDDSLTSYVRRTGHQMPRIFCICDEYADLISGDRKIRREIESQIIRLGQKARAAGIHLILATQQPSREIIKGVLDSNIPARVGLKMQKAIESKMLLNCGGAETLLGRGDLLYRDVGEPVRLQGAYLPPKEADEIFG